MHIDSVLQSAVAVALLVAGPLAAQGRAQEPLHERITQWLASREAALIGLRHDIHRHPETSGTEVRTAGLIAAGLEALGFEVQTGVGGYGVVGLLRGGKPGPMVAFRADMDAVESMAPDPVDFRSLTPGVRHICGHDVHVTVGIAIAEAFAAVRDDIPGSIMLIFQPAEESATGAKAMLADGIFAARLPNAIYAVHTAPYPVGQLGTAPGGMMAGRAGVRVAIRGRGDLADAADSVRSLIQRVGTIPPQLAVQPAPEGFILAEVFPGPA